MHDVVVRNATVWQREHEGTLDVLVRDSRVAAVGQDLETDVGSIDAAGRLLLPGLVDTHLHLDKSYLGEVDDESAATLEEAIARTAKAKWTLTAEEIHERAVRTLTACVTKGTTHVRTHVEIDLSIGLRGFEGVAAAIADMAWAIDVQVCVFPQEGLALSPESEGLLRIALEGGAAVIGGAPYADSDPRDQIDTVFDLAREFDVPVDLHLDLSEGVDDMQLGYVCDKTAELGLGGRVTVGHATQLSWVPAAELAATARRIADVGVAVTSLPSTDLYLMGREVDHAKPRGVAPVHVLRAAGVTCSLATNNIRNSFTPYGDCSLLRMANLYANVAHLSTTDELRACLSMVTDDAARIVEVPGYGVGPGATADLVLFDTTDAASAVAELPDAVWALKNGRFTFTRPPVTLHRPGGANA